MQAALASDGDLVIHEVFAGAILAVIGASLKVWSDQRADHRQGITERRARSETDVALHQRLERLENRTEAAIRLETDVTNLRTTIETVAQTAEDLRKTTTESHGVLQYLRGRAEQVDQDIARRRRVSDG